MIKKHRYIIAYMLVLTVFSTYVLLDTFVIPRAYGEASIQDGSTAELQNDAGENGAGEDSQHENGDAASGGNKGHDGKRGPRTGDGSGSGDGQAHEHKGKPGGMKGGKGSGKGNGKGSGKSGTSGSSKSGGSSESSSNSNSNSSSSGKGSSKSSSNSSSGSGSSTTMSAASSTDSYSDDNISIKLEEYNYENTQVHVAEAKLSSAKYLKTALAQNTYGRNITQTTSDMAEANDAILAINGEYYGSQESGYVIRNGKLYRSKAKQNQEDLVIYSDGSFEIINESEITAEELVKKGAVQTLSFGPALVENGKVSVDENDEVGKAMASNPRTAIGVKSDGTIMMVVSDGRTSESEGLSLKELAEFLKDHGAVTAYNLDGGGSSVMVFQGEVVNTPTGGGIGNGAGNERKVSDIVYIG